MQNYNKNKYYACFFSNFSNFSNHSFFNASAGFVLAARKVCQRTDKNAITKASSTATTNIQA